ACDLLDDVEFLRGEIFVPTQLLQDPHRKFWIAVLNLRTGKKRAFREKRLAIALCSETGAESVAAVHGSCIGVIQNRRSRMPDLRRAPARPGQPIIVATNFWIVFGRAKRH